MAVNDAPDGFCFVHAADLHLDTPFAGLSEVAPELGAALREASLRAFDRLVELCLERRAAFLLVAGDLYDGPERGLRAQFRLKAGLDLLADAGIQVFVVHGNHDPVAEGWSAIGPLPGAVHVFGSSEVGTARVEREGRTLAVVHGISYGRRDVTENLALRFVRAAGPGLQIGLLHCNLAGSADGHAPYSPCTLADLHRSGLDYWALGHVHRRTVASGEPFGTVPWVVYPGNLQARSRKPSECDGPKGASVVAVRDGRVAGIEHVACDVVRFVEVRADVTDCRSVADVRERLTRSAASELAAAAGRSLVLSARLVGRSAVHAELARKGTLGELRIELREEAGFTEPFTWWEDVTDETNAEIDLAAARAADDFVADLLRTADGFGGTSEPALPLPAASALTEDDVGELLGKMPEALRARALELLGEELTLGGLVGAGTSRALDLLAVEP